MTTRAYLRPWNSSYYSAPPSSCNTLRSYLNYIEWGYSCTTSTEFPINTACLPWFTSEIYVNSDAFFSPATACPSDWIPQSTRTTALPETYDEWIEGETAITCCPSGFSVGGRGCWPEQGEVWTVTRCGDETEQPGLITLESEPTGASMVASPVQIRYQSSDLSSPKTASATTTTTGVAQATGTDVTSPTSSASGNISRRGKVAVRGMVLFVVLSISMML